ncbi:MAG: lipoate--protein ligase family protein [Acidobacteriia bacterium]|nr:lipoate--protein ligase family protein [Chloroflexota bacterium]MYC67562.1 lipoate--protein ligase family protein [Terriglobia bacterium]
MEFIDVGVVPPAEGLRAEREILESVERARCAGVHAGDTQTSLRGGEHLLIWEAAHPAVVLPRNGAADAWAYLEACAARDIPILRRESGGGAVVLGPGCLNYALILSLDARPALADVAGSYATLLGAVVDALAIPAVTIQSTDLALRNRKFAGHAQRRLRRTLLHHGTILYRFDLGLIDTLLPEPPGCPTWRGSRRHREFLTNVDVDRANLVARLQELLAVVVT